MTGTIVSSVGGRPRVVRASQIGGQTITAALCDGKPQLERHLDGLFTHSPHRFSFRVVSAALRLDALKELVDDLELDMLPPGIRQSVCKRRLNFIGGRLCAEHSLRRLGLQRAAVGRHQSGEPMWPFGIIGSITHTDEMAYAAVSARYGPFSIGIDSERVVTDSALRDVQQVCCTDREKAFLFHDHSPNLTGTLIFSAKESICKAIHSVVRRIVDFCEIEVTSIDWLQQELRMRPITDGDLVDRVPECKALFQVDQDTVHTSVALDGERHQRR